MFPIPKTSSQGWKYTVHKKEIAELKKDENFMKRYRLGVEVVAKSWGWDIHNQRIFSNLKSYYESNVQPAKVNVPNHQQWQRWDIRLAKMLQSVEVFEEIDLLDSLLKFCTWLEKHNNSWVGYAGEPVIQDFLKK